MSEKYTENSDILSEIEDNRMSAAIEAPRLIEAIIGRRASGESQKAAFNRVSRLVTRQLPGSASVQSVTPGRLEDIWRGEARRIDADEMHAIRAAAGVKDETIAAEARHELAELDARIARIEALLLSDAKPHRGALDAFRKAGRDFYRPMDQVE